MKASPKKTYALEMLREAVHKLREHVSSMNPGYMSKEDLKSLEKLTEDVIQGFALHRGCISMKPEIAPWVPSLIPGQWPTSENDQWKASDHGFKKPLLNSSDSMPVLINPTTRKDNK